MQAKWRIVKVESSVRTVWIVDEQEGRHLSVTNDAERVVARINHMHPGYRIIYRDTDGNWDELVHDKGAFKGFRPARSEGIEV